MQDELFGSLDQAIYATVNEYVDPVERKRGATALAAKVGMLPATLSNKANPLQDHQLTLREAIPVQLTANDFRILYAFAMELHHVAYPLPANADASDVALLDQYAELHAQCGYHALAVRDTLRDGRVTSEEVAKVRTAFDAMTRAGLCFLNRLEALVDDRR